MTKLRSDFLICSMSMEEGSMFRTVADIEGSHTKQSPRAPMFHGTDANASSHWDRKKESSRNPEQNRLKTTKTSANPVVKKTKVPQRP